jgi:hypothetical protein
MGGNLYDIPADPSADSINRGTFIPVAVKLSSHKYAKAVVDFGYTPDFHCLSRNEACIAYQASVNETTPFKYPTEAPTGLACSSGCTITIPARSGKTLYYRWRYLDNADATKYTSPTHTVTIP